MKINEIGIAPIDKSDVSNFLHTSFPSQSDINFHPQASPSWFFPPLMIVLDLDDTLVPTQALRGALNRITISQSETTNDTVIHKLITAIDPQTRALISRCAISVIRSSKALGRVAVVTNARSSSWVSIILTIFPKLAACLVSECIPLIRTTADTTRQEPWDELGRQVHPLDRLSPLRNLFPDNTTERNEYAKFWTEAKRRVFAALVEYPQTNSLDRKVETETTSDDSSFTERTGNLLTKRKVPGTRILPALGLPQKELSFPKMISIGKNVPKSSIDILSIGDSPFEDVAAAQLATCPNTSVRLTALLKCSTGLPIECFTGQIAALATALKRAAHPQQIPGHSVLRQSNRPDVTGRVPTPVWLGQLASTCVPGESRLSLRWVIQPPLQLAGDMRVSSLELPPPDCPCETCEGQGRGDKSTTASLLEYLIAEAKTKRRSMATRSEPRS